MLVLISGELINTAIENLTDMVSFKFSYNAKKIKDVAAAAMLILSIMSIICSLMVLIRALLVVLGVATL
ncbi:MAG: diacylglycerol kinase family protein [Mycoplasmoidaceae bacterium]|nr:diacylglycerol kinase family protein [Mycoplasmoidaceae bacterium]